MCGTLVQLQLYGWAFSDYSKLLGFQEKYDFLLEAAGTWRMVSAEILEKSCGPLYTSVVFSFLFPLQNHPYAVPVSQESVVGF